MRYLISILAALWCAVSVAGTPPTCWPSELGGAGGPATYDTLNMTGPYAGWACPDGSSALYASRWGDVKGQLRSQLRALQDLVLAGSVAERQAAAASAVALVSLSAADVFEVWQDAATWRALVKEGETIVNIASTGAVIRYGAGTHWIVKTVWSDPANPATRSLPCTNAAFTTDPAPGVVKGCELAVFLGQPIPTPAPVYTHKVKPNGTVNDRPVYPFANGVRGTTAIAKVRAVVDQPCDLSKAQAPSGTSTTDVYAAFAPAFAASAVTLCTKQ